MAAVVVVLAMVPVLLGLALARVLPAQAVEPVRALVLPAAVVPERVRAKPPRLVPTFRPPTFGPCSTKRASS